MCHKKGGKKMKNLLIVSMAMIILLSSSIGFSQELVDMDKDNRIFYISENAWYELPMTGPASKTIMLKQINLLPGWQVRGMYTNKLLTEIGRKGEILFK
jgi:hypothetical protein